MATGFDESSADVRIAQYENNARRPKEERLPKIARVLDDGLVDALRNPPKDNDDISPNERYRKRAN